MKKNVLLFVLAILTIIPSQSFAQILYPVKNQDTIVEDPNGKLYRIPYKAGEIFIGNKSTKKDYWEVKYRSRIYYIKKTQVLSSEEDKSNYIDNRVIYDSSDVIKQSKRLYYNEQPTVQELNNFSYINSLAHGVYLTGNSRIKTHLLIDNFSASGTIEEQLDKVAQEFNNLHLVYDNKSSQKQVETIEYVYTMCQGATWLLSRMLDKTDVEYRYVTIWPTDASAQSITGTGHIQLNIKLSDGIWRELETTYLMLDKNNPVALSEHDVRNIIRDMPIVENLEYEPETTNHSYNMEIKSVGFKNGELATPQAEMRLVKEVY